MSVCVPFDNTQPPIEFASPLFVFTEKMRTNIIACHQVSNVSPIQLLLFGSKSVEAEGHNRVILDNMFVVYF